MVATDELNVERFNPFIFPVVTIDPVIPKSFPICIAAPSEDNNLFPAYRVVVPFNAIIPDVGSNITSPPPDVANVIFPSADCKVIVSLPASKIFNDCPLSVVICNSCPVAPKTFVPFIYKDPLDKYKCLNWCVTSPKSYILVTAGIIEPLIV